MRATCDNCGTPVGDQYCSSCGQSTSTIDVPVVDFARDMASEALGLDSRVRHTLWPLLFRPGQVPREYVEGHRAKFVPPVRLYLLASFFMFVVLSFTEFEIQNVEVGGRGVSVDSIATLVADSVASRAEGEEQTRAEGQAASPAGGGPSIQFDLGEDAMNERLAVGFQRLLADPSAFNQVFIDRMAKSMFVLLPAFAGLLKLLWWKRLYVHHLVFAIYFHTFVFLLVGTVALPDALGLEGIARISDFLMLGVPLYLVAGLRTFYMSGWVGTALKSAIVTATYGIMGVATMMILLVVSILSL